MPRFNINGDLSFRYGKTWQVVKTASDHVLDLIPKDVKTVNNAPIERWWILWASGTDPMEVWRAVSTPPVGEYAGLEHFAASGNQSAMMASRQPLSDDNRMEYVYESLRGVSSSGTDILGCVECRLYAERRGAELDITAIAALGVGEAAAFTRRSKGVAFGEGFRFEPYERRQEAEAARKRKEQDAARPHPPPPPPVAVPPSSPATRPRYRLCGICGGLGKTRCSSCGGTGSHTRSASRVGWNNRVEYYQEQVPCYGCSGGRVMCSRCAGVGQVVE